MATVALDSNVVLYALLEPQTVKGTQASHLLRQLGWSGVIPVQVLGEVMTVVRRKQPEREAHAFDWLASAVEAYGTAPTRLSTFARARQLVEAHHLQLWDAIIISASAEAGAGVLLSEDMQDGQRIAGLRILNPFAPENRAEVEALLA
jgi:predicted nucleic acid-binding protein